MGTSSPLEYVRLHNEKFRQQSRESSRRTVLNILNELKRGNLEKRDPTVRGALSANLNNMSRP